jgi:uncharacterized protein YdeI (YjbR/CyaY-like superfamily)
MQSDEFQTLTFPTQAKFRAWLEKNHAKEPGLWIKYAKKGSGIKTMVYAEAVEVALCYGWIDGKVRTVDESYYVQRFTPRRKQSNWSRINRDKAEALIAAGKMKPAGLAEVERAKADGRWDAAYESAANMPVPDDFLSALEKKPKALKFFEEELNKTNRYAILYQINDAKKPETRARRIAKFVEMMQKGEKLY